MKKIYKVIFLIGVVLILFSILKISRTFSASNLVANGDFEEPVVTNSSKWQIFSSDEVPGWSVEWMEEYAGAPETANLELHRGVLMTAYSGDQTVELDTDWDSSNNEPASVKIYQDIETCENGEYTLSYAWSPRPNHRDNQLEVYWGGTLIGSHSGDSSGWQLETSAGLTSAEEMTRLEFRETGTPDSLGMFLDGVVLEQTRECVARSAEITSPNEGEAISGLYDFTAYLVDNDYDNVKWAVRKGTCAAGQGTVFGNVDGHNDPYGWDYDTETYTHDFVASADTCEWEPGDYCFIFNPVEDSGEEDIRLTREFLVASCDDDEDGVDNDNDMCAGTEPDNPLVRLGTNRWIWNGEGWETEEPKGKGKGPEKSFTIEDTLGCNCAQILEWLRENYPGNYGEMKGHEKFGCSISIMEEFIEKSH